MSFRKFDPAGYQDAHRAIAKWFVAIRNALHIAAQESVQQHAEKMTDGDQDRACLVTPSGIPTDLFPAARVHLHNGGEAVPLKGDCWEKDSDGLPRMKANWRTHAKSRIALISLYKKYISTHFGTRIL